MQGIMLDNNHDLQVNVRRNADGLIEHGLVIGDITYQNQEFIVLCEKGEIKSHPIKGVGIGSFLDDETPENLIRNIRTELSQEGMRVNQVGFDANRNLVIDAEY
jgi:hypothetical protein